MNRPRNWCAVCFCCRNAIGREWPSPSSAAAAAAAAAAVAGGDDSRRWPGSSSGSR